MTARGRDGPGAAGRNELDSRARGPVVTLTVVRPGRRPPLTGLADWIDRLLLPLVLISAALGVSLPGPGRRADSGGAILVTLAVLVFSTGASMTFSEIGAIRTAVRRLAVVLPVPTVALPVPALLAGQLVRL